MSGFEWFFAVLSAVLMVSAICMRMREDEKLALLNARQRRRYGQYRR